MAVVATTTCSLFVDTSDLSGGKADAAVADALVDASIDADAGPPTWSETCPPATTSRSTST
ncbi:MAG: hypothetical protein ACRELY_13710 [Polyangiaceae bacterium]